MISAILTGLLSFAKEFFRTLFIDSLVGFCLRPVGL